ncbi:MAG: ABC transporter permease [Treponema sp.]|jgi:peptide/nickel transport system permease protein|nr:ABC transporter permease [Treponema sp.]
MKGKLQKQNLDMKEKNVREKTKKEKPKEKTGTDFIIGVFLSALVLIMALASFFYTPYGYNDMDSAARFSPPQGEYLFGTDNFGRDVFSRIMEGSKYTLLVALLTVAGSALAGSSIGLLSGYAGGVADEIIMRLMDTLSSFPGILLALLMVSLLGSGEGPLVAALLVLFVPSFVRIMRSGVLQYKGRDFVKTAELWGCPPARLLFVHILPNLLSSLLSAVVLGLGNAILAEATMSYLGLGIQPPLPSWGRMLAEYQAFLFNAPWCALAPGIMIMLTVLAFHYLGEGIRRRYVRGQP